MSLSGNFRTMSAGDLLQWLGLAQKTGTLHVNSHSVEKKVFFEHGRVISSASNDPREYLGQFLMSHGYITEKELRKAMEVQEQSRILIGKILVMINAITEADLIRLMRLKAEEEIYDIFLWNEGEFSFADGELPEMEMIPLDIDIAAIIMEGTRRVDEWRRIRELVPTRAMIPVIERPIDLSALREVQRTILQAVNGRRAVEDIILESRSSYFVVAKTIYDFVRGGSMRMIEPDTAAQQRVLPDVFLDSDAEVTSLLSRAHTALRTSEYEKSLRLLKAAMNLDPENGKIRSALKGAETLILGELKKEGINSSKVPRLVKPLEEISTMNFTPNEGFLLSRINGSWDLGSIVKVSPMREIDAMLIFYKLGKQGVVRFEK
jgi:hypothetical protein